MMWTVQLSRPNCFGSRAFQNFRRPRFFCSPFIIQLFNFISKMNLCIFLRQNLNLPTFYRPESFACKRLLSGKFSTFLPLSWAWHRRSSRSRTGFLLSYSICRLTDKKNLADQIATNILRFTKKKMVWSTTPTSTNNDQLFGASKII